MQDRSTKQCHDSKAEFFHELKIIKTNMINVNEYHGYLALPRHSMLLLQELGYDLFGFYLGLVMCTIWERKNPKFGRITINQSRVSRATQHDTGNSLQKFKELEKHKYFMLRSKLGYIPGYLPLFLTDVAQKNSQ